MQFSVAAMLAASMAFAASAAPAPETTPASPLMVRDGNQRLCSGDNWLDASADRPFFEQILAVLSRMSPSFNSDFSGPIKYTTGAGDNYDGDTHFAIYANNWSSAQDCINALRPVVYGEIDAGKVSGKYTQYANGVRGPGASFCWMDYWFTGANNGNNRNAAAPSECWL